ncbi:hypothetical protein EBT31_15570 [bacterium]|jgi:hypothetical protein|nr:hypothetical protein [bacterium]
MAYPTVDAPYGFKPVNRLDGLPYAGAIRQIPIANAYNQNIFYGDIVQLGTAGTVIRSSMSAASSPGTAVAGTIGVFMGCSYTNASTGQKLFSQYYPASTAANDIMAFVVDDPRALFKAVVTTQSTSLANSSTTVGYLNQYYVGSNLYMVGGAGGVTGSTTTGDSKQSVSGAVITSGTAGAGDRVTSALPFRMVGVVPETAVTLTGTGSTSGSSATVTLTAAVTGLLPGMQLICPTGTGTLAGNYATVINVSTTTLTLNAAVTLASGSSLSFVGFPEVLVAWNGNFHSYNNTTGV